MTLWRWDAQAVRWAWVTEYNPPSPATRAEDLRRVLRGHRRRSPWGTRFRWTTGTEAPRPYKPRRRP